MWKSFHTAGPVLFCSGARHELLVETNKLEVFADIAA